MNPIVQTLSSLEAIISILIFIRIVISFVPQIPSDHPLVNFLMAVTEPILAPFRNILPTTRIGIDFSPLLAMFTISAVFGLLIRMVS